MNLSSQQNHTPSSQNAVKDTWLPESQTPRYKSHYGPPDKKSVLEKLERILANLERNSPARIVDRKTGCPINDFSTPNPNADIEQGQFRIISYEWGVVYAGMLHCGDASGNDAFLRYAATRLQLLADATPYFRQFTPAVRAPGKPKHAFVSIITPRCLDDAGSIGAAMIKASRMKLVSNTEPLINNFLDYICQRQHRLSDGTLARKRPVMNTLWLDDLYMSVPALSQMYLYSGKEQYLDEAVRQVTLFSRHMFNQERGLYPHGWFESARMHLHHYWSRANGWALLAKAELLEVLPVEHPGYKMVLELFQKHALALAHLQGGSGFWHQLLDRLDTFEETSSTAIFSYCFSRGINRGWLDSLTFGPCAVAAWNAVASCITDDGYIGGTCVGSGLAMDPVFYCHRPQSQLAAHSYGPALLAGGEMLRILDSGLPDMHDSTTQFGPSMEEA